MSNNIQSQTKPGILCCYLSTQSPNILKHNASLFLEISPSLFYQSISDLFPFSPYCMANNNNNKVSVNNCFFTAQGRKCKTCIYTQREGGSLPLNVVSEKRGSDGLLSFDSSKQHMTKGGEQGLSKTQKHACEDVVFPNRDIYTAQFTVQFWYEKN